MADQTITLTEDECVSLRNTMITMHMFQDEISKIIDPDSGENVFTLLNYEDICDLVKKLKG